MSHLVFLPSRVFPLSARGLTVRLTQLSESQQMRNIFMLLTDLGRNRVDDVWQISCGVKWWCEATWEQSVGCWEVEGSFPSFSYWLLLSSSSLRSPFKVFLLVSCWVSSWYISSHYNKDVKSSLMLFGPRGNTNSLWEPAGFMQHILHIPECFAEFLAEYLL